MTGKNASIGASLKTISAVLLTTFLVAVLYFGRDLLVPMALAALLTFMLAPLATKLQRWLGRIGSVLLVAAMLGATILAAGWVLTQQVVELVEKLPNYKDNIRSKFFVFMLLQREELRNRMIRLIGQGHLSETTRALDDAGARISR